MTRTNNSRGYTLVEMLVGMVILLMVIAGALSFFIFQSTEGFESFRLKRVDEAVSLAESVIVRDIVEAGFGLSDHPELALYITQDTAAATVTPRRDTLYVSYNGYLTMDTAGATATGDKANAIKWNTVFFDAVPCSDSSESGAGGYQGFFMLSGAADRFTLRYCSKQEGSKPTSVGGIIAADAATGATKVTQALLNDNVTKCVNEGSPLQDIYNKCTFKLASSTPAMVANDTAAPAICYRCVNVTVGKEQIGALWRNPGGAATPVGMPFLGGETFFEVTGFEVDYQIRNADGTSTWSKNSLTKSTATTLKLVRVRLTYRTRGKENRWSPPHIRTITASPRNLVLGGS